MLLLFYTQLSSKVLLGGLRGVNSGIDESGGSSAGGVGRIGSIIMLSSSGSLLKGIEVGDIHTRGCGLSGVDGAAIVVGGVWAGQAWSLATEV